MSVESDSTRSRGSDDASKYQDLFYDQASPQDGKNHKPWWKTQFFVVEPVLFGTWNGVFTSCLINIFGVVLFLRTGWMVGNVGIGLALLIVVITITVALLAALSAIGVCERLRGMGTGGVYYVVSQVLGGKVGGAIGVMYTFGLSVVAALYCTGFAESVTQTFNWNNDWAVRGVAIGTLILLLAINLAGVKWVIRLQVLLLLVLVVSTSDFIIGTFVHTDPAAGFVGYSYEVMRNNTYISLQPEETFFTVFGVFFPTATGVMAGVNMSGDLRNPSKSIPTGTLSAIGISFCLYIVFVLLLGSTCLRSALQADFMIAEKVSAVGVLWLLGIYMSSTSSCSTGLYGAPRVLQSIANENVIPVIKFLGKGFGANKTPVIAICVVGTISLIFILIGNLNVISPVITCNFMLVYAVIDYSYFALAMSYDLRIKNFSKFQTPKNHRKQSSVIKSYHVNYGSIQDRGTMDEFTKDLDNLFKQSSNSEINKKPSPIKISTKQKNETVKTGKECLKESFTLQEEEYHGDGKTPSLRSADVEPIETATEITEEPPNIEKDMQDIQLMETTSKISSSVTADDAQLIDNASDAEVAESASPPLYDIDEILKQPKSCYSIFCNRWSSLFGATLSIIVMFLINWIYALSNILAFILLFMYTSLSNPGLNPGASSSFSFVDWMKEIAKSVFTCRKRNAVPEQYVIFPTASTTYSVVPTTLTKDNEDFANRSRFHQSAVGDYDYASLVAGRRTESSMSESSS